MWFLGFHTSLAAVTREILEPWMKEALECCKQRLRDCSGSLEDQNAKRHVGSEGLPALGDFEKDGTQTLQGVCLCLKGLSESRFKVKD